MAITNSVVSNAAGVCNKTVNKFDTDSATAAAVDVAFGYAPRKVTLVNLTDRITHEWYEGMTSGYSLKTVAAGTRTLETSGCIGVTGSTITLPAALLVASKSFVLVVEA